MALVAAVAFTETASKNAGTKIPMRSTDFSRAPGTHLNVEYHRSFDTANPWGAEAWVNSPTASRYSFGQTAAEIGAPGYVVDVAYAVPGRPDVSPCLGLFVPGICKPPCGGKLSGSAPVAAILARRKLAFSR